MKKRNSRGFTLSETLTTVLLLAIVFAGITGGIVAVSDAYQKITVRSEAQTLLSTTVTEISKELREAVNISSDDGKISFYSARRGRYISIQNGTDTVGIVIREYSDGSETETEEIRLLSEKTETSNLVSLIDPEKSIQLENGVIRFAVYVTAEKDMQSGPAKAIISMDISIRPYSAV